MMIPQELPEAIQEQGVALLEFVKEGMQRGTELAAEQVPLLVQEILYWNFAKHATWAVVSLLIGIGLTWISRAVNKAIQGRLEGSTSIDRHTDSATSEAVFGWIIPIGATLIGFAVAVTEALGMLKIWLAPRLYVITELGKLFNG